MTDLEKLLAEARKDRAYTMSCEYGRMIIRTVCSQSDATLKLEDMAPQLAAALIKAEEALVEATEIVHKEYVRATLEAVNAGPSHPLQKQADAWRIRCMKSEASSRAALSEIEKLTGGGE